MDQTQPQPEETPAEAAATNQPTPAQIKASNFVKDVMTGKVKIEAPKPKPQGAAGTAGFLLGGMISKDSILLGTIVILLLVIIAMTTFVIGSAVKGGINVTFDNKSGNTDGTTDSSNTDGGETDGNTDGTTDSSNTDGGQTDGSTPTTTTKDLTIMMLAMVEANKGKSFPPGTTDIDLGGTVDFKLVPISVKTDVAPGEDLETALKLLFGQDPVLYKGLTLNTELHLSDIEVNVISDPNSVQVQLTGDLVAAGDLSPVYIYAQIEGTIKKYATNYVITLNGSATDYKCFGDMSGECK